MKVEVGLETGKVGDKQQITTVAKVPFGKQGGTYPVPCGRRPEVVIFLFASLYLYLFSIGIVRERMNLLG